MKVIRCELCEGRNVLKQNGVYICQDCGAQYTVEEAKALMVEVSDGEVVSRVVPKAESNSQIDNFKQLARRAREAGNVENAAKYYEMVVIQDPNDWEAAFYSVYYQSAGTNIAGITNAATNVENCLPSVMHLIKSRVPKEEQVDALSQIAESVLLLCETMRSTARSHYNQFSTVSGAAEELRTRLNASYDMVLKTADLISKFDNKGIALPLLNYLYGKNDITSNQRKRVNSILDIVNPVQAEKNRKAEIEKVDEGINRLKSGIILVLSGAGITILSLFLLAVELVDQAALILFIVIGIIVFLIGIVKLKAS